VKLKRRALKTLKKKPESSPPPPSTGQLDVGAPKVDTFSREIPNVALTRRPR